MAILLLQPVCEAAEPVGIAGGESCCASAHSVSIVPAADAVPVLAKPSPLPLALSALTQRAAPAIRRAALDPPPPPRGLPYHARSARLLL